ncbi:MAG: thioredoxin family protein [Sulfurovum sp.]|nr:MAG: thioredoxin family protein [Sulfurovum sp.]
MKKIVMAVIAISSLLFAVEWVDGLDAAMKQAKKEQKVVMAIVVSKECRWCKKMKHRTLSDERVEQKLKQFVSVQVMRDNNKEETDRLPKIDGVPTIFFLTPNGKVIQELLGYMNVEDFLSYISDIEKSRAAKK